MPARQYGCLPLFGFMALSGVLLFTAGFRRPGFLLIWLAVALRIVYAVYFRGRKADDIDD